MSAGVLFYHLPSQRQSMHCLIEYAESVEQSETKDTQREKEHHQRHSQADSSRGEADGRKQANNSREYRWHI